MGEVLSPTTENDDRRDKLWVYTQCFSIQEYMVTIQKGYAVAGSGQNLLELTLARFGRVRGIFSIIRGNIA